MSGDDHGMTARRALRKRVKDNGVVSITFGAEAKKLGKVPFLKGTLAVAAGPPGLALSTGARLLPVYALRREDGGFDVTVDRPLEFPAEGEKNAQIESIVNDMANRLGPLVEKSAGQWGNWSLFQPPADD